MLDFRSDTVTVPCPEMREAMLNAPVGDDVYGEDPSVNELQDYTAELLGKEAAIFLPSGTMGNQIGLKVNTIPGDEVICEQNAHIFYYETAAASIISQIQLHCIPSKTGMPDVAAIENAIRPDVYYYPKTKVIALENTHNRHGGTILGIEYIKSVKDIVDRHSLKFHLDGARLWNASAATGISMKEYASPFDTVNICLSKGLGAPSGSLLCGTRKDMEMALKWRKILGGGMRQIGIIAKGGLFAIQNNFQKLAEDHANAKLFANTINKSDYINCDLDTVQTNMAAFTCTNGLDAEKLRLKLAENEILMHNIGNNTIRTVFHLQVNKENTLTAANTVLVFAKEIMENEN